MLKTNELRDPASCLNKAADDEPVFVLLARDPCAAQTVRAWASMSNGVHSDKKRAEALRCADLMDSYRQTRTPPTTESKA